MHGTTSLKKKKATLSLSLTQPNQTKPISHSSKIHHQHNSSEMNSVCVNEGTGKVKQCLNLKLSSTSMFFNWIIDNITQWKFTNKKHRGRQQKLL